MASLALNIGESLLGPIAGMLGTSPQHQLENTQAQATEQAQFAGAMALYYAYAGDANGVAGELQAMASYVGNIPGGQVTMQTLPGGKGLWGVYYQMGSAGFDVPNPWASVGTINQAAFNAAHQAVSGRPLTFAALAALVEQVLAAHGGGAAVSAGSSAAALSGVLPSAPLTTASGFSWTWILILGAGVLALLLLVRK